MNRKATTNCIDRRDFILLTSIALQIEWMCDRDLKSEVQRSMTSQLRTRISQSKLRPTRPPSKQSKAHSIPAPLSSSHPSASGHLRSPFQTFRATDSKAVSVTGLPSQPSRSSFRCRLRIINIRPSSTSAEFLIHTFSDCSFCAHSPQVVASHKTQAQRSAQNTVYRTEASSM